MQLQLDQLQQQLEIVERFETLFASKDTGEFNVQFGSFKEYMKTDAGLKTKQAFDGLQFAEDSQRGLIAQTATNLLKRFILKTSENTASFASLDDVNADNRAFSFFSLAISAFQSLNATNTKDISIIIKHVRDLIAQQKAVVVAAIADIKSKIDIETVENIKAAEVRLKAEKQDKVNGERKKALRTVGIASLFTTGAGLTTVSGLMQFNPAFAVLVGVHLPVAALATFAAAGLAMSATAAYLAYRAYHPTAEVVVPTVETAPVVANPLYPKLVTAALMTSGLNLAGFSALVQFSPILTQFSPKFALLAGLHLSPVALIAIAAVGALLVSVALYRVCKSYMQARADAAAATPATPVVETPAAEATAVQEPCYTRAYKYVAASCCFKFGGAAKPATTELNTENQATAGASATV